MKQVFLLSKREDFKLLNMQRHYINYYKCVLLIQPTTLNYQFYRKIR